MNPLLKAVLIKSWQHLELSFISLSLAMIIAIPLGIILAKSRSKWLTSFILRFVSILQTIPGLAMLALIIVLITFIRPILSLPTTGFFPASIVLVLYSLLPLLTSTYTGIKQVSPQLIEVAKSVGMRNMQTLFHVELPLAFPVILSGVRLALVWTIGMVTLTALVGSGGLGELILQGLKTMQIHLVLAGTIPAALMAIVIDGILIKVSPKIVH